MPKLWWISSLLLLVLRWSQSQSQSQSQSDSCPHRCQCFSPVQVLCADERMSALPRNMSGRVREFILMTSSLTYLFADSLHDSPQLSKLVFLNNAIRSVHAHSFRRLPQLEELEISGSPVLEHLYLGTFSVQINLSKLTLNYNRLRTVLPGLFSSLKRLDTLQMKQNVISHLPPMTFSNMSGLRELDLSLNKLEGVTRQTFAGLGKLEVLKLNHNLLRNLSSDFLSELGELTELHLEGNKLSELSENLFTNLTKLEVLNLRGNALKRFDCNMFGLSLKLRELNLKGNLLSEYAPLGNLSSLTVLDLSSNQLSALHGDVFKRATHLERLDLSDNHLNVLSERVFNDLFNLKEVDLRRNNLTKIEPQLFKDQARIERLILSHNRLETLPEGLLDAFSGHHTLELHGNPWKCDCGLWYLHDWVLQNAQRVQMLDRTLCESPGFLNRRALASVDREQLVCRVAKESSVDVRSCLLHVAGDAVVIRCKVETCLQLKVKVQLQDEQGRVKEHVVTNEAPDTSQCSAAKDDKANPAPDYPDYPVYPD